MGLVAYLSAVFNSLGEVLSFYKILEDHYLNSIIYASLHLWITAILCLLLINVTSIPEKQRLKIVTKILVLSFFIGMTKGLNPYQDTIFLVLMVIILGISFYFSHEMTLTFSNMLVGGSMMISFLIFKILGFNIFLLLILAMIFLKSTIDHFVLSIRGDSEVFK